MNEPTSIHDHELHAYVDGQLDAQRCIEIENYLATHPQAAEYVNNIRQQNRLLHKTYDAILDEPVPSQLLQSLEQVRKPPLRRYAALVASLFVGVMTGFFIRGGIQPENISAEQFTDRAAIAHVVYAAEVLHPVEVTADKSQHLLQWLSKRLGHTLHTPDLTQFGYQIMGGRLLPGDKTAAAQFMYQDSSGKRLTLYISIKNDDLKQTAFRIHEEDGVQVLYWVDNKMGFALVGDIDRASLLNIARVTYQATS